MRRILPLILAALVILILPATALAADHGTVSASNIQSHTAIAYDGTCQVSLTVEFRLSQPVDNLTFPLPREAKNITVNSYSARTYRTENATEVKLNRLIGNLPGNFTLMFSYSLPDTVAYNDQNQLILTLPMLSGFQYPVEKMNFTVSFPGQVKAEPGFSSGYYQASIESNISFTSKDNAISGQILAPLKDQETLTMTIPVTSEVFPQEIIPQWQAGFDDIALYVCAGLALLYWLLFLRCLPPVFRRTSLAPDSITAGQIGTFLTGCPADLSLMVLSWAQLGYVLIHADTNGRVYICKRMEMGNERSVFENRCFKWLFAKAPMIDGTGTPYAKLCEKVEAMAPDHPEYYHRRSGNPKIMRLLICGVGLFGGLSFGLSIGGSSFFGTLLAVILAALSAASTLFMVLSLRKVQLGGRKCLIGSGVLAVFWLLIGWWAGEIGIAASMIGLIFLLGLLCAYGGRRTDAGKMTVRQILGLRRYLKKVNRAELLHVTQSDPEFFFTLAPYALALGVDKAFAGRFGAGKITGCTYLTTGMDGHRTPSEWNAFMKDVLQKLTYRQKKRKIDRLLRRIR